jgi:hypothetical protein
MHQEMADIALVLLSSSVATLGIHSLFKLRNASSIGALSQQFPRRLMLWRMRCGRTVSGTKVNASETGRCSRLTYWVEFMLLTVSCLGQAATTPRLNMCQPCFAPNRHGFHSHTLRRKMQDAEGLGQAKGGAAGRLRRMSMQAQSTGPHPWDTDYILRMSVAMALKVSAANLATN